MDWAWKLIVRFAGLKKLWIGVTVRLKRTVYQNRMDTPKDTMILNRTDFTDKSTIGDLYIDGQWTCFILEPSCRKQEGVKLAIPQGKYEIVMYESPHFKMRVPLLLSVPGHDFIEIHPGNCPADTHDCLLPGQAKDTDYVMHSVAAWSVVAKAIEEKLKLGKCYIGITGGAPNV